MAEPADVIDGALPQETETTTETGAGTPQKKQALGPLLDKPEQEAARLAMKSWSRQDPAMKKRLARWKVNAARRAGDPWTRLIKDENTDTWYDWTPPGMHAAPPAMLKTDTLIEKVVANVMVDRPKPEGEPASGEDEDKQAAEFATRVLEDLGSESGIAVVQTARRALNKAGTYGSAFVWVTTNPRGDRRPQEAMAGYDPVTGESATTLQDAEERVDPMTGQATPWPAFRLRYVTADGTLTDQKAEAAQEDLPTLEREVLTGKQVRFLPETADGISTAHGVVIGAFVPLGTIRERFPGRVGKMSDDDLHRLVSFRPDKKEDLLPDHAEDDERETKDKKTGKPNDDAKCFVLTVIYTWCPSYPKGCYAVFGANRFRLFGEPWLAIDEEGVEEKLDVPLAQFRWKDDVSEDDPYGRAGADILGPADEIAAQQLGALIEHLDRFNHPHLFLPFGTIVDPKLLQARTGTPIFFNPANGGKPEYEQVPEFSESSVALIQMVRADQNSASGLEEAAQGVSTPEVGSGKHAQQVIEQALVSLSPIRDNTEAGLVRLWRIMLQQVRAYFTTPQQIKVVGEDGRHKQMSFTRADLRSTKDVRLAQGSLTMLAPSAKAALIAEKVVGMVISPEEGRRMERDQIRPLLGLQDDPHEQRVQAQIAQWMEGPPDGFEEQAALAREQQAMIEQEALAMGQMAPPMAPLSNVFDPRPNDEEPATDPSGLKPGVANIRHYHLSRAMASTKYAKFPPVWRQVLDMEYDRMRRAAGVATLAEQQMAMQQQQDQAMQAEGQENEADREAQGQEADKDRAMKMAEGDSERALKKEMQQHDNRAQMDRTLMQAAVKTGAESKR